jgi:anti-sigma B factor antagonist
MDMQVLDAEDGITRVVLDGRFDIAGAQEVDLRFSTLAGSAKALVVDMGQVSFLASMGVRTLMLSAKTMIRRKAIMAVCAADENVEKVLRSTGFDEIVDLYPDFAAAATALTKAKA